MITTSTTFILRLLSTLLLAAGCLPVMAQYYDDNIDNKPWELDVHLGPTVFLGDVGGGRGKGTAFIKDINPRATRLFYGINLTYYPEDWVGIRTSVSRGTLVGFDSLIRTNAGVYEKFRRDRNLGFRSSITEASVMLDIYPTVLMCNMESPFATQVRPYLGIGIGFTKFNPQGEYVDPATGKRTWVDLQPLMLEGQGMTEYPNRKAYATTTLQIPLAIGVKYYWEEKWFMGLEVMQRFTFTDYIDDVSTTYIDPALFSKYLTANDATIARQMMFKRALKSNRPVGQFIGKERGDSNNNDYYLSFLFRIGFRFGDRNASGYGYVL